MHKMTAEDLRGLKHGDIVHRFDGKDFKRLHFVGKMPGCESYLIFCNGEYLTHLHISSKDDTFAHAWYNGEYDSKFAGNILINKLKDRIESVKKVYLKEK